MSATHIDAQMIIDGTCVDIVKATFQYGVDVIPTAVVVFPAGSSTAEEISSMVLSRYAPQVVINVRVTGSEFTSNDYRTVFEGIATATAFSRNPIQIGYSMTIHHWAILLANASLLSSIVHPASSPDLVFNHSNPTSELYSGVGMAANVKGSSQAIIKDLIDDIKINKIKNLWDDLIKPVMLKLISSETLTKNMPNVENKYAKALLEENHQVTHKPWFDGSSLEFRDGLEDTGKKVIRSLIIEGATSTSITADAWTILSRICRTLGISLIPLPTKIVLAPTIKAANIYRNFITTADYDNILVNSNIIKPLRGVVVFRNKFTPKSRLYASDTAKKVIGTGIVGEFLLDDNVNEDAGLILHTVCPSWIDGKAAKGHTIHSSYFKQVKKSETKLSLNSGKTMQAIRNSKDFKLEAYIEQIGQDYARWLFANEAHKYKFASISSKLRFDISPGTLIRVQSANDRAAVLNQHYIPPGRRYIPSGMNKYTGKPGTISNLFSSLSNASKRYFKHMSEYYQSQLRNVAMAVNSSYDATSRNNNFSGLKSDVYGYVKSVSYSFSVSPPIASCNLSITNVTSEYERGKYLNVYHPLFKYVWMGEEIINV